MNWGVIAALGEAVGAVAVVVSVVYLAIQLRSNTKSLRTEAYWNSVTIFGKGNLERAQDAEFATLFARASREDAVLTDFSDGEVVQIAALIRGSMELMMAQWLIWKEGGIPDEFWERRKLSAQEILDFPIGNQIWEMEKNSSSLFPPDFISEFESGNVKSSKGPMK